MKEVLTFLTACAVLAVANALTTALAVALLLAALLGAVTFPRQTFAFLAALGLLALALREPLACVGALAAVGVVVAVVGQIGRRIMPAETPPPLLLTDQRRD